jgi:hypothetical protein
MFLSTLLPVLLARALAQDGAAVASGSSSPEGTAALGSSDVYVIQPGDTLWGISERFLGDSEAWPQLWSVNTYITNPHWIYPGNQISFRLGDSLNPPSAVMGAGSGLASGGDAAPVEGTSACGFPAIYDRTYPGLHLYAPGVIGTPASLNLTGTVYGADKPGRNVGEGAYLYVEMSSTPSYDCGQPLAIYRRQGNKLKTGRGVLGHVFRVLAVGEVARVDGKMVTLRLRESYSEVTRGDLVGDAVPVDLSLDVTPPGARGLEANVLARLNEPDQQLAAVGETVFLDRGVEDGIDVGASLFVVERRDGLAQFEAEDAKLPERVVGRVVIVRSEPDHATGVVVDAARDIQVGARLTTRPNGE